MTIIMHDVNLYIEMDTDKQRQNKTSYSAHSAQIADDMGHSLD